MDTMAAYGWGKTPSVAQGLESEPWRFSFLAAVRLLEQLRPGHNAPATEPLPEREGIRFRGPTSLAFPASEVRSLSLGRGRRPASVEVGFLGVAGALGPLPRPFAELLVQRKAAGDRALADFLDLFQHRLIALFYRSRRHFRPPLAPQPPDRGSTARSLYALLGLGTPRLGGRLGVPDQSLLMQAGLLVGTSRSMAGLERLLSAHFAVQVQARPFQGAWLQLSTEHRSQLGERNCRLGQDTVLGSKVWDQQASFELGLGPLDRKQLYGFLPQGDRFRPLLSLIRFYVGEELEFSLRLKVRGDQLPALRLGRAGDGRLGWSSRLANDAQPLLGSSGGSRLGWTSWLRSRPADEDDEQLVLRGRPMRMEH